MKPIGLVGAGPAGTVIALSLIRKGVDPDDVVLSDNARFPRPKLCGGGITLRAMGLRPDAFESALIDACRACYAIQIAREVAAPTRIVDPPVDLQDISRRSNRCRSPTVPANTDVIEGKRQ
jgi:2-polyprenyl-6-methoxyphenol hydroxylase-like FAD-dependent oxidoreductase